MACEDSGLNNRAQGREKTAGSDLTIALRARYRLLVIRYLGEGRLENAAGWHLFWQP